MNIKFFINSMITPSSRFRVLQYLNKSEIKNFELLPFSNSRKNNKVSNIINTVNSYSRSLRISRNDRIFLQRMILYKNNNFVERQMLKRANKGVVVDFDDAIFIKNPNFSEVVRKADHVICGNDYLANWALYFNSNVKIIPTVIDTDKFKFTDSRTNSNKIIIGWSGTKDNLIFVKNLIPIFKKIVKEHKVIFKIISNNNKAPEFLSGLPFEYVEWNENFEVEQLKDIDIGLMPLDDNIWTRGKCGFKLIMYMSMGIISVGSNVGANKQIINDERNGYLANNDEWHDKIMNAIQIIKNDKAEKIKENARNTIVSYYSINSQISDFKKSILDLK